MGFRNILLCATLIFAVTSANAQTPTQDAANDIEQLLLQELDKPITKDTVGDAAQAELEAEVAKAAKELHRDLIVITAIQMAVLGLVIVFIVA